MVTRRMLAATTVLALVSAPACATAPSQQDAESKAAIQAVIERAIDRRNHQVVAGFSSTREELIQDFVPDAVDHIELEYGKLRQRRDTLAPYGVGLTASTSDIAIEELTISKDRANAVVSEQTHLSHAPVNGVQGPEEGYVYGQKVELAKTGVGWKIVSIAPINSGKPFPTTVIDPSTP